MQQTETYKLNLIETSDPFSPNPLNENAEKTDAALAGLDARVTTIETGRIKMAIGTYNGSSSGVTVELPFTPIAVIIRAVASNTNAQYIGLRGQQGTLVEVIEGGFKVPNVASTGLLLGGGYNYVALG